MTVVPSRLIFDPLKEPPVKRVFHQLENDEDVKEYLRISNMMAVDRLN